MNWSRDAQRGRAAHAARFSSLDDLVARTGLRRDELVTLADIGALNAFGYDRRSALWQAERAVGRQGAVHDDNAEAAERSPSCRTGVSASSASSALTASVDGCPLKPMTEAERLVADYAGTGLTSAAIRWRCGARSSRCAACCAPCDLRAARQGRRVRVAGMVITRQRPGTAKGFVFLTLEDETGIANIIVRPDLFARDRLVIVEEPFLIVDGVLQNQDGVTSVRAEQVQGMRGVDVDFDAHDFY